MVEICIDERTIELRNGRPATGAIWMTVQGRPFPNENWNDQFIVLLDWWAEAALKLLRADTDEVQLQFMDGPFLVSVRSNSVGSLALAGLERTRSTPITVFEATVERQDFVDTLCVNVAKALDILNRSGWKDKSSEQLRARLTELAEYKAGGSGDHR